MAGNKRPLRLWITRRRATISTSKHLKHLVGYDGKAAAGQCLRVMDYLVAVLADRDQIGLRFLREALICAVVDMQALGRTAALAPVPVTLQR